MEILAKITGIEYKTFLCKKLREISLENFDCALSEIANFILVIDREKSFAISKWVSPKRTRSYPNARVYNTLAFSGKKVTIIPIFKDEGKKGDRDYLQWDTISLMSLLGVYVIISYYTKAERSSKPKYKNNKITNQIFDISQIKNELEKLTNYQSDALHWNLKQIDMVGKIGEKALNAYEKISNELGIEMHSSKYAEKRIKKLLEGKEIFMNLSRKLAQEAQSREIVTIQPKELVSGEKASLTIKNYLGGYYYFTVDEVRIEDDKIFLIEAKHTKKAILPSINDIKEGLVRMILFTNLEDVTVDGKQYIPKPVLKLTSSKTFDINNLSKQRKNRIDLLINLLNEEAKANNFEIEYP